MYHGPRWSTSHQTDLCRSRPPSAGLLIYQHLPLPTAPSSTPSLPDPSSLLIALAVSLPLSTFFSTMGGSSNPLSSAVSMAALALSSRSGARIRSKSSAAMAHPSLPRLCPNPCPGLPRPTFDEPAEDRPVTVGRYGSPATSFARRLPDCRGIWHRRRGTAYPHRSRYDLLQRHPAQRGDRTHMCSFKHL